MVLKIDQVIGIYISGKEGDHSKILHGVSIGTCSVQNSHSDLGQEYEQWDGNICDDTKLCTAVTVREHRNKGEH